jgi:hypothetical protein
MRKREFKRKLKEEEERLILEKERQEEGERETHKAQRRARGEDIDESDRNDSRFQEADTSKV